MRAIPVLGPAARRVWIWLNNQLFPGSKDYWETRYHSGNTSGCGSYGKLAEFKADILNGFVERNSIQSVIEFGCGDGNQLSLARYPRYIGLDVSPTALKLCENRFAGDSTKQFRLYQSSAFEADLPSLRSDLALSLDVVYHLVEDEVFENHLRHLFAAARRFVIVYSSDTDENPRERAPHVRHRRFTAWIDANLPDWVLTEQIPNPFPYQEDSSSGTFADFYVYERRDGRLGPGAGAGGADRAVQ
ncbi:MAG: class I SAM-dependent methyltransferase [Candidatus Hydrogenedentes bacterium]|nr:class I SAM-dependent methyltransferase [Candidatus Hydrogenedentota bacterium]